VSDVRWLEPIITRGVVQWPDRCEAQLTTKDALTLREVRNQPNGCGRRAKVDFRGSKLCVHHAKMRALDELAGKSKYESLEAT
jgi:hypothetical protein